MVVVIGGIVPEPGQPPYDAVAGAGESQGSAHGQYEEPEEGRADLTDHSIRAQMAGRHPEGCGGSQWGHEATSHGVGRKQLGIILGLILGRLEPESTALILASWRACHSPWALKAASFTWGGSVSRGGCRGGSDVSGAPCGAVSVGDLASVKRYTPRKIQLSMMKSLS